jgi:putative flippase GtrA
MIRIFSRVWKFLWRFSFFRFGTFHVPAGALNYAVAFLLFWYAEVDKYTATTVGHFIHVAIGFFYDRDVTFRAKEKRGRRALVIYWFNETLSFASILLTIYILVDFYAMHLLLAEFMAWPYEWAIASFRAIPAMIIGTAITYGLNKIWTFNEVNSQPKLL